nr:MAG TPA: hypothetical protein [Caudoviricetes sp.]
MTKLTPPHIWNARMRCATETACVASGRHTLPNWLRENMFSDGLMLWHARRMPGAVLRLSSPAAAA